MYAGIEAGGTKMVLGVADENMNLIERVSIPTTTPEETIERMIDFFRGYSIDSLGIGCFGPLDLKTDSDTYGYITSTPKLGWQNVDMLTPFKEAFGLIPVIDTDVNAAILGEVRYGAAKDCSNAIYITIGTGIGVGAYINGGLVHGYMHPEAGHILINRNSTDTYTGGCRWHDNCFEGLASGPAIEKRWGIPAEKLIDRPEVWELESDYIAQAITNYILCYSPEKVVLWGGVMHVPNLMNLVREKVHKLLGGYVSTLAEKERIDELIVEPGLRDDAGIIGAIELGRG